MNKHTYLLTVFCTVVLLFSLQPSEGVHDSIKVSDGHNGRNGELGQPEGAFTSNRIWRAKSTREAANKVKRKILRISTNKNNSKLNWISNFFKAAFTSIKYLMESILSMELKPSDLPTSSPIFTTESIPVSPEIDDSLIISNPLEDLSSYSSLDIETPTASPVPAPSTNIDPCNEDNGDEGGDNTPTHGGGMGGMGGIGGMRFNIGTSCGNNDVCGDGIIGESEECDGENIGNISCKFVGCDTGKPSCNPKTCKIDYSQCGSGLGESIFQIELKTDSYGEDTFWEFSSISGDALLDGGNYGNKKEYSKSMCVPDDQCYKFEIHDNGGNGICCGFGDGGYAITFDSVVVPDTNGAFGRSANHTLCPNGVQEDRCGDGVVGVSEECDGDSFGEATCFAASGCSGGSLTCDPTTCKINYAGCAAGSDEMLFQLDLKTDNYGSETTWELSNDNVVQKGGPYGDNELVRESFCLKKDETCYQFEIRDSGGDGLCCGYGDGSYSITVNTDTVPDTDGNFGSNKMHSICASGENNL